jgi:hypothetical protein
MRKQAASTKLKESDIQRTVMEYLQWDGWRCFHFEYGFDERSKKTHGEEGMPDLLCIRYGTGRCGVPTDGSNDVVMWLELKRPIGDRATQAAQHQRDWHLLERKRGAFTLIAGQDFPATIEGFQQWYEKSGLKRR